ncbi:MAG: glycoside hydrolase family 127 protein [Opitutaceae bacterium]|nr:glycoside hydrolase family 127 protein [Opitutaceae bacterium]
MHYPSPACISLDGLLGTALASSKDAHLLHFIRDEHSRPLTLFCPEHRRHNCEGDWYGEHAGKWLCAASHAVERTGDSELRSNLRRVADFLVSQQESDGYLGTYAPSRRFTCVQGPAPRTWDGAPAKRTWDVWIHSYLILGLLEAARVLSQPEYLSAARRIGDLCWQTLVRDGVNITSLGNHHGLSATVLLDPAVELHLVTGEPRYLELAEAIIQQANVTPALELLPQILAGTDLAYVATGKAYQLCWNLVGLAKLHRATHKPEYLRAVELAWRSIRDHHLTLGGGPWGGVAHRSREVFNPPGVFSPYGYVETCSTFSWIQLNRELLAITGAAKYAEEIEKSAYNDLLGAQSPAGDNWCYYSFPNGRRVFTTYWRCCKSSGPWALEELPSVAYGMLPEGDVSVNLYGPGRAMLQSISAGRVELTQETRYPWDGLVLIRVHPEREARWGLSLRIPSWAEGASLEINGVAHPAPLMPGDYTRIERQWLQGDIVALHLPMLPRLHRQLNRNVQESRAPDGSPVAQEVLRFEYAAITCGPLVYSTGLIDGFKVEETVRLPALGTPRLLELGAAPSESGARPVMLHLGYRPPLTFLPYYEAGGRRDGTWRLTWLQLAPEQSGV